MAYSCQNEWNSCLKTYDANDDPEYVLQNWHSECDGFDNFHPTTPVISSLTATYAPAPVCSSIDSVCTIGGSITRACKQSYTASALTSCLCQSSLLSAASVCEYVGNKTCELVPATLSSIDLFILCPVNLALISSSSMPKFIWNANFFFLIFRAKHHPSWQHPQVLLPLQQ